MTPVLWIALFAQIAMGGFDSAYHHEFTERLSWRPSQVGELKLHGVRNLAYAVMFAALGWTEPHGAWAAGLLVLMVGEMLITLWDFVEEDRTRKLPATERVTHTLLTLNYGVILAMLVPILIGWAARPNALRLVDNGVPGWLFTVASVGVTVSGLHDLFAARRASALTLADPAPLAAALAPNQAILVTGGTGFIGRRLIAALVAAGHDVTVLTRETGRALGLPAPLRIVTSLDQIGNDARIDAIVNLAGEPISDGLWTLRKRRRILRSRLSVTREVLRLIERMYKKPGVLVSGSAIGWYGLRDGAPLDETSAGIDCFSRRLCVSWEREAVRARDWGVRTVLLRTGLVLDVEGGVLSRLLPPFEFGLGGRLGGGRQWMSWIHRDDLVRLIVWAIARPSVEGALNGTAPTPVDNRAFTRALGRALRRPAWIPVPALPMHLALGEFADELLLGGQKVLPAAALAQGFSFAFPTLDAALRSIVGRRAAAPRHTARAEKHTMPVCLSASRRDDMSRRIEDVEPVRRA